MLERNKAYSILSEYSAQNSIRCIRPTGPNHVCWIDVFQISWNANVLEMILNLKGGTNATELLSKTEELFLGKPNYPTPRLTASKHAGISCFHLYINMQYINTVTPTQISGPSTSLSGHQMVKPSPYTDHQYYITKSIWTWGLG